MHKHTHHAASLLICGSILSITGIALWLMAPGLDRQIFDAFQIDGESRATAAVRLITDLGGVAILGPLALAVVLILLVKHHTARAIWLFATIASGRLAVELLKELIARPRPPLGLRLDTVETFSFPSSHAAGSLLTWLTLSVLFSGRPRWLTILAIVFPLIIGWTRMALGVHWPSDVIAGYGLAMIWVGLASRWRPPGRIMTHKGKDREVA